MPVALVVLDIAAGGITAITRFIEPALVKTFLASGVKHSPVLMAEAIQKIGSS